MQGKPQKVRVLRLLEYTYTDAEEALEDQKRWFVQGTWTSPIVIIKSAVVSPEFLPIESEKDNGTTSA